MYKEGDFCKSKTNKNIYKVILKEDVLYLKCVLKRKRKDKIIGNLYPLLPNEYAITPYHICRIERIFYGLDSVK